MTKKLNPFVDIRFPVTKKEMKSYWGSPCRSYEAGCPTCKHWRIWEKTGKTTIHTTRAEILKASIRGVI